MKIASYRRRSTDEAHQPYTLPAQKDSIVNYVKSQGTDWEIVCDYQDSVTGKTMEREGLQAMLSDAKEGKFDVLVVYRIGRLSRRLRDFVQIIKILEEAGVAFKSVTEPIDTSSSLGKLLMHLLAVFAQFESDLIVERTVAGMDKKAKMGEWCGGFIPYGYTYLKEKKMLMINEEETVIIRMIFYLYTQKGMGAKSIAKKLNHEGYRTRRGHLWSVDAVIRILRSPLYVGKIARKDTLYSGKHPAIIPTEVREKAQRILNERSENHSLRRSNGSNYFLSGLLRCARCGARLVGVCAYGRREKYKYYVCNGKMKHGECGLPSMPKERLEKAIFLQLKEIFSNATLVNKVLEKVNLKLREKIPVLEKELELLDRKIRGKEDLATLYFKKFEKEKSLSSLVEKRLKNLAQELEELKQTRHKLHRKMETQRFQPASFHDIEKVIADLERTFLQASTGEVKKMLRLVIRRLDVHSPEFVEPYYRIPVVRIVSGMAPRTGLEPVG